MLAAALFAGSVAATPIVTDGLWNDWFSYGGNVNFIAWNENLVSTTNVNIRTLNDEEGPTPGGGGQDYDIEQIFYYYDDADPNNLSGGTFHVGLVTGFNPAGTNGLQAGDLFLDFGNTGGYNMAIAVGTDDPGRFEDAWFNTGSPNWTLINVNAPFTPASDPYRVDESQPGAVATGGVDVAWGLAGRHWFMEVTLAVDATLEEVLTDPSGGMGMHWTMECGNDNIRVSDDTPFVPVPEPATVVLLGIGVLGIALRARHPAC
jgi:hypothetical protein